MGASLRDRHQVLPGVILYDERVQVCVRSIWKVKMITPLKKVRPTTMAASSSKSFPILFFDTISSTADK